MKKHVRAAGFVIAVVLALSVWVFSGVAYALINPNFTPLHMVEQSNLILLMKFNPDVKDGKAIATILETLKGKAAKKEVTVDLTNSPYKQHAEVVQNMITNRADEPALFFVGEFADEGEEAGFEEKGKGEAEGKAYLNIGGQWITLYGGKNEVWEMDKIDSQMLTTWNGGTDMLLLCTRYIISDPDADVPVKTEAEWETHVHAGKVTVSGKVSSVQPVDLKGDGTTYLYVASDKGDRLLLCDPKKKDFKDVTAGTKLSSKSVAAVWADFNTDGKLDLLSWDGKSLSKHLQNADGTLAAAVPLGMTDELKGCMALAAVDCGKKGVPAVVASTTASPVLLLPGDGGKLTAKKLVEGALPGKGLKEAGICRIGDFDGDLLPDMIQLFSNGGLFYKGKAGVVFDKPGPIDVGLGQGTSGSYIGDWDHDGRLDVMTAAEDRPRLWHNYKGMNFLESFRLCGEPSYIAKPGGIGGQVCDINNDGRQDFLIFYSAMSPQFFFNRGYRSFGHSHTLDLAEHEMLPEAENGQQAACVADFNNDGGQDLALVLSKGEVWVFFRDNTYGEGLCARVALPLGAVNAGPVAVTGWIDKRCMGTYNVVAGTSEAFFGIVDPGPVTIKWQLPGGKPQKKQIVVENKPVRFVIAE